MADALTIISSYTILHGMPCHVMSFSGVALLEELPRDGICVRTDQEWSLPLEAGNIAAREKDSLREKLDGEPKASLLYSLGELIRYGLDGDR